MTATHPHWRLKLALLVTTCVHLALLVATGAVAIVLLQHQNSYGTLTVGIDDSRRAAAILVLIFYIGLLFSLPQVAVCALLLARRRLPSRGVMIVFLILNVLLLLVSVVGAGLYTGFVDLSATFDGDDYAPDYVPGRYNGSGCVSVYPGISISGPVCQRANNARRFAVADFVLAWVTVAVALAMSVMAALLLLRTRKAKRAEAQQQVPMGHAYPQHSGYAAVQQQPHSAYPQQPFAPNVYPQQTNGPAFANV